RARGVAGLRPDVSQAEIERLDQAGFRGARLSTHVKGYGGPEAIAALWPRLQSVGWHIQLHVLSVNEIADLETSLMKLPVPIVFDHLGGVTGNDGLDSPGFRAVLRILRRRDNCWVKSSSWYRRSNQKHNAYADMKVYARALVEARQDRVVYGSNWPHPNL